MSKPNAEPIIFKKRSGDAYITYRATLKTASGRGRNSVITIKEIGNSSPLPRVILKGISPESEKRLFRIICQDWWIDFVTNLAGLYQTQFPSDIIPELNYLTKSGVSEQFALRAIICFRGLYDREDLDICTLFDEFSSLDMPMLYDHRGKSSFESFIQIALHLGVETAQKAILSAKGNYVRLSDLQYAMRFFAKGSELGKHVIGLSNMRLTNLTYMRNLVDLKNEYEAAVVMDFLAGISEEQLMKVGRQLDSTRRFKSLTDSLDEKEVDLWNETGGLSSIIEIMESSVTVQPEASSLRIFFTLLNRFGLNIALDTFRLLREDDTEESKRFIHVFNVAKFLEDGGDSDTPLSWIISLSGYPGIKDSSRRTTFVTV